MAKLTNLDELMVQQLGEVMAKIGYTNDQSEISKMQQFGKRGWYEAGPVGTGFPLLLKCCFCRQTVKPDDVVYAYNESLGSFDKIVVQHKECMESILHTAPYTTFEKLKEKLRAGGSFYG